MNQLMLEHLRETEEDVVVVNLSAKNVRGSLLFRVERILGALAGLCKIARSAVFKPRPNAYLSVSGGSGQWIDSMFVAASRVLSRKVAIHHHNFSYFVRPTFASRVLFFLAGRQSLHLVLCHEMQRLAVRQYPNSQFRVISNLALQEELLNFEPRPNGHATSVLGFISNIEMDKGISEFIQIVDKLRQEDEGVVAVVAGPFQNKETEDFVTESCSSRDYIIYVGPVSGQKKSKFFQDIDVLVFPTKYANEAEPLVVIEALTRGIPVISTRMGCIPEMIDSLSGVVVEPGESGITAAAHGIKLWLRKLSNRDTASGIFERTRVKKNEARKEIEDLVGWLSN